MKFYKRYKKWFIFFFLNLWFFIYLFLFYELFCKLLCRKLLFEDNSKKGFFFNYLIKKNKIKK